MTSMAKSFILIGLALIAVGIILALAGKVPWLGRLPGDIAVKRGNFSFYFPLTTCILASVLISLLFYLFKR